MGFPRSERMSRSRDLGEDDVEDALDALCADLAMLGSDGLTPDGLRRCKWGHGRAGRGVAADARKEPAPGPRGPLARALDAATAKVWKALHDVLLLEEKGFPDPDAHGAEDGATGRDEVRDVWAATARGDTGEGDVPAHALAGEEDAYLRLGARLSVAVAMAERGYPEAEALQRVVVEGKGGRGAEAQAAVAALVWLALQGPVAEARARRRLCLAAAQVMLESADEKATREVAGAERVALARMAVRQLEAALFRKGLVRQDAVKEYLERFAVQVAGKGAPLPPYPQDPPPPDDPMHAGAPEEAETEDYVRTEGSAEADDHAQLWRQGRAAHDARVRASMQAQQMARLMRVGGNDASATVAAMTPYEVWVASDPVQRKRHKAARDAADHIAAASAQGDRLNAALARWLPGNTSPPM